MKINIVNIPIFIAAFRYSAVKIVGFATKNKNGEIKLSRSRKTLCGKELLTLLNAPALSQIMMPGPSYVDFSKVTACACAKKSFYSLHPKQLFFNGLNNFSAI